MDFSEAENYIPTYLYNPKIAKLLQRYSIFIKNMCNKHFFERFCRFRTLFLSFRAQFFEICQEMSTRGLRRIPREIIPHFLSPEGATELANMFCHPFRVSVLHT